MWKSIVNIISPLEHILNVIHFIGILHNNNNNNKIRDIIIIIDVTYVRSAKKKTGFRRKFLDVSAATGREWRLRVVRNPICNRYRCAYAIINKINIKIHYIILEKKKWRPNSGWTVSWIMTEHQVTNYICIYSSGVRVYTGPITGLGHERPKLGHVS